MLGGMDWFDALLHAFTTMATGGVGTKNASIGHFDSIYIDGVIIVFMLLAGFNFNLYYRLLQGKFRDILCNTEAKVYVAIVLGASLVITIILIPVYGSLGQALRYGSFQVASILTTAGFTTADYQAWPSLAQAVLFCLMFIGGCSASTAGGIKVIRHIVLFKQAGNEMRKLLYSRGVFTIQLNQKVGRKDVVYGVAGFVSLYIAVVAVTTLITASSGTDLFSSFSIAFSAVGNASIGFGAAGPGALYAAFPDYIKWTLSFVMIAGRLELWTVFMLFSPEYWRR
jgi:trk system potassium uptake protein TrkH